ncbi:MAG: F0F1 ATP synthase subunit delta [Candidatus Omnitrophica bacterium]|nr:F0F1 ATP synthase subunit delta [Candidatus Omnitrophota bacterium]
MIVKLFILQLVTFVLIIFALRMLFYRHLNSALKRLKDLHEENLIKESQLKDELVRAKKERESEVEKGKIEAKRLIAEAKKSGESLSQNMNIQAQQEAQRIIEDGKDALEKTKKELIEKNEAEALKLSQEVIEYTLTAQIMRSLHHELLSEVIEEIRKIENEKFFVKEQKINVISSYELSDEEKVKVKELMSSKLGLEVELQEEINPRIIGGLIIKIGGFVVDGSLENKFKKAIAYLKGKQA